MDADLESRDGKLPRLNSSSLADMQTVGAAAMTATATSTEMFAGTATTAIGAAVGNVATTTGMKSANA